MRLIDADKFDEERAYLRARFITIDGHETAGYHAILTSVAIKDAPTIDAVPVVRCRDCLYYQQLGRCGARSESYTDPDGFCHMGVKKEEET